MCNRSSGMCKKLTSYTFVYS